MVGETREYGILSTYIMQLARYVPHPHFGNIRHKNATLDVFNNAVPSFLYLT